jgi:hypothetical protein
MSMLFRAPLSALFLLLISAGVSAQIAEVEPNDSCQSAQDLDDPARPFFVNGSLDSTDENPDVDFYRAVGQPGETLQVDLEGQGSGMGTLSDPYLGLFNSACELVAIDDDSGGNLNSRLYVVVPDDGIYVLSATRCCDSEFVGGGQGSYTLTVSVPSFVDSIVGRAVDADTFASLPGDAPPFAFATLSRCDGGGCYDWVNSLPTGPDGRVEFTVNYAGVPIQTGDFELVFYADGYLQATYGPFTVGDGESFDAGDVPLTSLQLIGSIAGRLVDAVDGVALPGTSPPFSRATLERCEDWGCYPVIGDVYADEQGRFRFEGWMYGLSPGDYRVLASAEDYYPLVTESFFVGDDENVDLGDLGLRPLPIRIGEIVGCDVLPLGGVCEFSVEVGNRGPGRYRGEAWAIARYFSPDNPERQNRFQIGRVGADNPMPQRINIAQGKGTVLSFRLEVPATAVEGTYLCVALNLGRDPSPQFDAIGDRLLFCATAQTNGFERLSAKSSRRLLSEPRGRTR